MRATLRPVLLACAAAIERFMLLASSKHDPALTHGQAWLVRDSRAVQRRLQRSCSLLPTCC